ncbi:MAG: leucyl aminopeptidase [Candidatus Harrisonbacteria bacterium CG10_big_fil_rev_8_21_14_0_10_49_15]|uniref:Leucyl aminopeptidase n=1 Tax=Candidatus Harrisonbacteria bacterium CG10_big_fil_rev_8_21_14_0_10_49_15 TaxID=1974587 RepID=A0A2H0UKL0_9BACT|nr:MAG: leucyl aminopeptidase [Candidatus Harrisonbacteria bacterium CG10_big_fil_rev_8_21_14_0_10_49_15]
MKFSISSKLNKASIKNVEAFFLPVWVEKERYQYDDAVSVLDAADQKLVKNFLKEREPKAGEVHLIRLNKKPGFVFLSVEKEFNGKKLTLLARKYIRTAKKQGFKEVGIYIDDLADDDLAKTEIAGLFVRNSLLAHYDFSEEFKAAPKDGWKRVQNLTIFSDHDEKELRATVKENEIIAEGVNRCRTLSNYPPVKMTPEGLAEAARDVANECRPAKGGASSIKVTVFDEKKLYSEGMNAILAVGGGSDNPPRLVIMEYKGGQDGDQPLAIVGKGITFDSGGLNIKPGEYMSDMHMDMSGGSATIYAVAAIAKLKLPINVIGFIPAAENMPSGKSYRQNDIITAYGGKTMEIGNTDAEGRVVMADAIEYAKTKKPALLMTIATLTGAAMVALGTRWSGLFVKDNKDLRAALESIGETSGDAVWPLPLTEQNEKEVEGIFADVTNTHKSNSRYGGASSAAGFLSQFAGDQTFAHLDMAPRMTTNPEEEALSCGAAGFGVAYFVELAKHWETIRSTL